MILCPRRVIPGSGTPSRNRVWLPGIYDSAQSTRGGMDASQFFHGAMSNVPRSSVIARSDCRGLLGQEERDGGTSGFDVVIRRRQG